MQLDAINETSYLSVPNAPVYRRIMHPEGISIADRLWQAYPEMVRIWRMGVEEYAASRSEEGVSENRLAILEHIRHPLLRETAGALKAKRKAAYQENILSLLLEDVQAEILRDGEEENGNRSVSD